MARAREVEATEPLVAYYCNFYSLKRALELRDTNDSGAMQFVTGLLEKCEAAKVQIGPEDGTHRGKVEEFALSVFDRADTEDRDDRATKATALTFYAAMCFIEICSVFGPLTSDLEERLRYAKWKAAEITKALREGRRPVPGAPGEAEAYEKAREEREERVTEEQYAQDPHAPPPSSNQDSSSPSDVYARPSDRVYPAEPEPESQASRKPLYPPSDPVYPSNDPVYPSTDPVYPSTDPVYPQADPVYPESNNIPPAPPLREYDDLQDYEVEQPSRKPAHLEYPPIAPPYPSSEGPSPLPENAIDGYPPRNQDTATSGYRTSDPYSVEKKSAPLPAIPSLQLPGMGPTSQMPTQPRREAPPARKVSPPTREQDRMHLFGAMPPTRAVPEIPTRPQPYNPQYHSGEQDTLRPPPHRNAHTSMREGAHVSAPIPPPATGPTRVEPTAPPAPARDPTPIAPTAQPTARAKNPNYKPPLKQSQEAQRLAKYALSALDFQDFKTAVSNLEKALELLTGPQ